MLKQLVESYNVQLEHVSAETTWQDHGFVTVLSADGATLAHSADFQHNRNYHKRFEMADELMESVNDKMAKGAKGAENKTGAPAAEAVVAK